MHRLHHCLIASFAILFLCSGAFIIGIVYTGAFDARQELEELPTIIDKAGYRRTLAMSLVHWQREIFQEETDHPLSYFNIVQQF
jgi:hypothetical protein